ncbi:ATP-binding protein [Marisediminicola antarctica]|uniref:ATP-binding protein n=1 Tax=Marisediminicola antarctica TaxID=674079 RepID=UPI001F2FCAA1|nr:ATP-binding protein [Marisediminicola antarctica]
MDKVLVNRLFPKPTFHVAITIRDSGHVTALETIALAAAPPGRPHRKEERIPQGTAARRAAMALTGTAEPTTVISLAAYPVTTATPASVYQQLRGHLAELKLADASDALPRVLDHAQAEGWSLTHALERLLSIEVTATDARRLSGRFRFANLPTGATLDDFDLDAASGIDRNLLAKLGTCRYLETATNVLLIGPPGVGKTHTATGLGHAAVTAGYRTYFTSAADLAARCHRAATEGKWGTMMRSFAGPTLLVIDLCRARDYVEVAEGWCLGGLISRGSGTGTACWGSA